MVPATQIIEEVGINEQRTLEGLIDKIFDKALTGAGLGSLVSSRGGQGWGGRRG